ncbi:MAG: hydrogenase 4 subunit F [Chloroflexi bacterium]|nr:hydrogenase 4 subunit F [Chloroflexota bacterium]
MTLIGLLLVPLLSGLLARFAPRRQYAEAINVTGAGAMAALGLVVVVDVFAHGPYTAIDGLLYVDALSALVLLVVVTIGLAAAVFSVGYLRHDIAHGETSEDQVGWYYLGLHAFFWTMLTALVVDNLGALWVAIEATTLASALLVGFYRTKAALEAAWKYLILCTVGITFALLGLLLIYAASDLAIGEHGATLNWTALLAVAPRLDPGLMRLAFIFVVIGFGAKAGFAPLHAWLPDAHSQAPSPISALLSGVLLNCALYGVLRLLPIVGPSAGPDLVRNVLVGFGLLSVGVAVPFILVQRDLKRLLAYSSVEHVGLITVAVGLGGTLALYAGLLHLVNHAVTKPLLFFAAGDVVQRYQTRRMGSIRGAVRAAPLTGSLLLLGVFAIAGLPPSGIFLSEFGIVAASFGGGALWIGLLLTLLLATVFGGMCAHGLPMVLGRPIRSLGLTKPQPTTALTLAPLAVAVVGLGVWVPPWLTDAIEQAAAVVTTGGAR